MNLTEVQQFCRDVAIPIALDTMRETPAEDGDENPRLFPTAYLLDEDGSFGVMVIAGGFPDHTAQVAFARFIEQTCRQNKIAGLVFIAEVWVSALNETRDEATYRREVGRPSADANRRTAISTIMAAPDGMDIWLQPVEFQAAGGIILEPIADEPKGFRMAATMPNPWGYRGKSV